MKAGKRRWRAITDELDLFDAVQARQVVQSRHHVVEDVHVLKVVHAKVGHMAEEHASKLDAVGDDLPRLRLQAVACIQRPSAAQRSAVR